MASSEWLVAVQSQLRDVRRVCILPYGTTRYTRCAEPVSRRRIEASSPLAEVSRRCAFKRSPSERPITSLNSPSATKSDEDRAIVNEHGQPVFLRAVLSTGTAVSRASTFVPQHASRNTVTPLYIVRYRSGEPNDFAPDAHPLLLSKHYRLTRQNAGFLPRNLEQAARHTLPAARLPDQSCADTVQTSRKSALN
jgi:hypothetical protein